MKKLMLFLVIALFISNPVFSDDPDDNALPKKNLFNPRFVVGNENGATFKMDHFHNWDHWASFVEVSPSGGYALVEFGPRFSFPNGSLTLRTGFDVSVSKDGAKYVDQQALEFFFEWRGFSFLTVNEIKGISINKPFHWSADQYYYEHDLTYGRFGAHIEAVWWGKNYKAFAGPSYSFPVGVVDLILWPGFRKGGKKVLAIEMKMNF